MRAWLVDTFADSRYQGNPAAVVIEDELPATEVMQAVARRLDQPTTAFLSPLAPGEYRIRWFTPYKEINLCGHASIASAGYLYSAAGVDQDAELRFVTTTGHLYVQRTPDGIAIDMPRADVVPCDPPPGLREAIGADIVSCASSSDDLLIEVASAEVVAAAAPRFELLVGFPYRGHIVTAAAGEPGADFVSRTFFPALGVNEDQVCVSAHCKLGPYWGTRLGKARLVGLQLSERGGRLRVQVGADRVKIVGTARPRESYVDVLAGNEKAVAGS